MSEDEGRPTRKLDEIVQEMGIKASTVLLSRVERNKPDGMPGDDLWSVVLWYETIHRERREYTVTSYHTGKGNRTQSSPHKHFFGPLVNGQTRGGSFGDVPVPPTATDVLGCLLSDISTVNASQDIIDWAMNSGYTSIKDMFKVQSTYGQILAIIGPLKEFLRDRYEACLDAEW